MVTSSPPNDDWAVVGTKLALHDNAVAFLRAAIDSWPREIGLGDISKQHLPRVVAAIQQYAKGPRPLKNREADRPHYERYGKGFRRGANIATDMLLCMVAPIAHPMRADEQPGQYVLRLVEHYAAWDLAKFVFLLPGAVDMSRVGDKLTTIAIDQLQIAIYKGIENVLFQIYDELPEKGRIDDTKVRDILLRIIGGLVPEPLDDKPDTASYLSREVVRAGIAQRPTSEDDVGAEVCVGCGTTQDISGGGVALNGKSGPLCSGCMRASAMGTLAAVLGEFVQGKGSKGPKG